MLDVKCYEKKIIIGSKLSLRSECWYSLYRVIPRHLNFMCRRFGILFLFHLMAGTPPTKMEQTQFSEKLAEKNSGAGESPKRKNTPKRNYNLNTT